MYKFLVSTVLLSCLLAAEPIMAQSFAPGTGAADSVQKANQQVMGEIKPSDNVKKGDENKNAPQEEEGAFVKSVEKNFAEDKNKEEEKKYDNSMGKVFQFRIENDKVIFDEDRKILVSYENFKVERGMDNIVRCSMRIYVLNDLIERISSLGLKLKWPKISTNVQMNKVNPGVRTYMDVMLFGEGCFSMDKTPTIEVNRCRVKGMSESKCADAIRWFKKTQ